MRLVKVEYCLIILKAIALVIRVIQDLTKRKNLDNEIIWEI